MQIKRRYDIKDIRHDSSLGIYKADELDSIKKTYDGFNRLIKYEDGENTAEYEYNAKGQRISKKVNGTKSMALWNGDNIAFELNATGGMVRKFARGYDLIRSNDGKYYLHNGHGDVVSITNNSGNVIKSYSYDSFGNEKNIDKNDTNPWRYCGEYYDNETGSIYLRARYYDPGTGRFMTEDPARDGVNWYSYCGGNPVYYIDISGLSKKPINIIKKNNNITIDVYLMISGNVADKKVADFKKEYEHDLSNVVNNKSNYSDNLTYREIVEKGIKDSWNGKYDNKNVEIELHTIFDEKDKKKKQNYITIDIKNFKGISCVNDNLCTMYVGDLRNNNTLYTSDEFAATVGHEFGHLLGLDDVYNDDGFEKKICLNL